MFQNDAYKSPLRKYRQPPGRVPTLSETERAGAHWFWVHCQHFRCTHSAALPWAPIIAKLGSETSADRLRATLLCTACGHRGANVSLVGRSRYDLPAPPIPTAQVPQWVAKHYLRAIGVYWDG